MSPVPDPLRRYQLYVAMFLLNLAVVIGIVYLLRREEPRQIVITQPTQHATLVPATFITVSVGGAVKHPGQVQLDSKARLADALQRAGGVLPGADLSSLDLTLALHDGDKISIPSQTQSAPAANNLVANPTPTVNAPAIAPVATAAVVGSKINLNTATLEELDTLPGIGPTLAQRILDYRAEKGGFRTVEELQDVRGIGEVIYDDLKDLVTVE